MLMYLGSDEEMDGQHEVEQVRANKLLCTDSSWAVAPPGRRSLHRKSRVRKLDGCWSM